MPRTTAAAAAGAGAVAVKKRGKGAGRKFVLPFAYSDSDPRCAHLDTVEGCVLPEFLPPGK